jgi:hypothetical protein
LSKGELNNLNMSLKEDQPVGVANSDIDTDADIDWEGGTSASSTYSAFRDQILALLTSIAARVQSNGPSLCRRILLMMHDNLWLTWFPTDSPSLTAGWTRKGIFELQELVFFGCNSTSNVGGMIYLFVLFSLLQLYSDGNCTVFSRRCMDHNTWRWLPFYRHDM